MQFHNLLVIASAIQCYVHKILRTVRVAENPTGPKLPDFTLFYPITCHHRRLPVHRQYHVLSFDINFIRRDQKQRRNGDALLADLLSKRQRNKCSKQTQFGWNLCRRVAL